MTETDWLHGSDILAMLHHVRGTYTLRHARLFAVACCRASPVIMQCPDAIWRAVLALEAQADMDQPVALGVRQWVYDYWRHAHRPGFRPEHFVSVAVHQLLRIVRHSGASNVGASQEHWPLQINPEDDTLTLNGMYNATDVAFLATHTATLRDLVGNPFRPVGWEPHWLTANVVQLAQMIYDWHAFERMPILGDALMDAGCEEETILDHCRAPHHVRGCWLLDRILGKCPE